MPSEERWLPIPGYEDHYEVSDQGRVRSLDRMVKGGRGPRIARGRALKPAPSQGYWCVALAHPLGGLKTIKIAKLVMLAFVGPSIGYHVSHENGDRTDDRLENLAYRTQASNNRLKFEHGTMVVGSRHAKSKITEADVLDIRASQLPQRALAEQYGLDQSTICRIRTGRRWAHVSI